MMETNLHCRQSRLPPSLQQSTTVNRESTQKKEKHRCTLSGNRFWIFFGLHWKFLLKPLVYHHRYLKKQIQKYLDHGPGQNWPLTARSGAWPRRVPGNEFLAMLLIQNLLGMMKVVVVSCYRMSMTIWVRSSSLKLQGLGPDQGESQGMSFWQCCWYKICWG